MPLLGKVFDELNGRYRQGLEVSLSVLGDYAPAEISHIAAISQRHQGPVNEDAFRDCVRTVLSLRQQAAVSSDDDLLALRNKLKERKGTKA